MESTSYPQAGPVLPRGTRPLDKFGYLRVVAFEFAYQPIAFADMPDRLDVEISAKDYSFSLLHSG